MRTLTATVCACLLVVGSLPRRQLAFAAAAQSPPGDASFSVDLPADYFAQGACEFPIRIAATGKGGTILLSRGRSILTSPALTVVVTNLTDPADLSKTVTLKATGAFHNSTEPNGDVVTTVTGRNVLGDPEAGFVLAIGTFSYTFDSSGNLIQPLTGTGQLINVCELIA